MISSCCWLLPPSCWSATFPAAKLLLFQLQHLLQHLQPCLLPLSHLSTSSFDFLEASEVEPLPVLGRKTTMTTSTMTMEIMTRRSMTTTTDSHLSSLEINWHFWYWNGLVKFFVKFWKYMTSYSPSFNFLQGPCLDPLDISNTSLDTPQTTQDTPQTSLRHHSDIWYIPLIVSFLFLRLMGIFGVEMSTTRR